MYIIIYCSLRKLRECEFDWVAADASTAASAHVASTIKRDVVQGGHGQQVTLVYVKISSAVMYEGSSSGRNRLIRHHRCCSAEYYKLQLKHGSVLPSLWILGDDMVSVIQLDCKARCRTPGVN